MKQEIEDDKMTRNRLKEEDNTEANPYQMTILNKVSIDDQDRTNDSLVHIK